MVFCVFRGFCVKLHTEDFSHTQHRITQNLLRMAFCVFPWILCETPHTRFSHTDSTEISQNLSAWYSVYSVDSVWNSTQKIFRTQIAQNFTEIYSAWHSVYSVDSVWNTTQKIFRTQIAQNYTEFIRMVFCVFRGFCVKHHTQDFSHTQKFHRNYSAWHSVCSVDSVWNTTQKIFRTQK